MFKFNRETICVFLCACCSVAVENTTSLSTAVCSVVHTVSEGSGGLQWGRVGVGGLSLPSVSPCLNAAPPRGESVVLPVKVTPKTHDSQSGGRESPGGGRLSGIGQSSRGRDSVAHHWSHHDQQKDARKKSTHVFFFVFFSTS